MAKQCTDGVGTFTRFQQVSFFSRSQLFSCLACSFFPILQPQKCATKSFSSAMNSSQKLRNQRSQTFSIADFYGCWRPNQRNPSEVVNNFQGSPLLHNFGSVQSACLKIYQLPNRFLRISLNIWSDVSTFVSGLNGRLNKLLIKPFNFPLVSLFLRRRSPAVKFAKIVGSAEIHVKVGSTISLLCIVNHQVPSIQW